jgi:hypothetical protein
VVWGSGSRKLAGSVFCLGENGLACAGENHCRFSRDLKVGLVPTDRDVPFHQGEGKNKIVPLLFFIANPSTMFRAGASNKKV